MNVRPTVERGAKKMPSVSTIPARMNVVARMASGETELPVQVLATMEYFDHIFLYFAI